MTESLPDHVLLVEDNPDHADLICMALSQVVPDAEITWIDHGTRAIEHLDRAVDHDRTPGVILLDLKLPGHSGLEVLRHVRSSPALTPLPVIVLTSSHASEDREAAQAAGASRYLVKEFRMEQLTRALQQAMSRITEVSI